MTAREMAAVAVEEFFDKTGECSGKGLAFDAEKHKLAYDLAWEVFLNADHTIPNFCIVEDFVHEFLLYGV